MRIFVTIIVILSFSSICTAQYTGVDKIISELSIEGDTLQAIYNWAVSNIKYDPKELRKREGNARKKPKRTKKDLLQLEQEQLNSVLKKRKGVCEHYAILVHAVATELGMSSHIVEGYTKDKNGRLNLKIGHAWNAVQSGGKWKLLDATWGAGYVNERNKFVKSEDGAWYDVPPHKMLTDHMPFDPIWQLLDTPITYDEFKDAAIPSSSPELSQENQDLIDSYLTKDPETQVMEAVDRSEELGKGISLVKGWRRINSKNMDSMGKVDQFEAFNNAATSMERLGKLFKDYYKKGREKDFKGKLWTKGYSSEKLQELQIAVQKNLEIFQSMDVKDSKFNRSNRQNISHTKKLSRMIEDEIEFLQ